MSSVSLLILLVALPAQVQSHPSEKPAGPDDVVSARAGEWLKLARQQAAQYQFHLGTGGKRQLTLRPKPVLQWTNPREGESYSYAFIWTNRGRPEVMAEFITRYTPRRYDTHGFQSLCLNTLTAQRDGRRVWQPSGAGVKLKAVPDAPTPAGSPAGRLRQLRALARTFSVHRHGRRDDDTEWQRLLTAPIYRYESADRNLLDGAMFVFVSDSVPKLTLLIEARRTTDGHEWRYAPVRLTSASLRVFYNGREVWDLPKKPWSVENPREPEILFYFK